MRLLVFTLLALAAGMVIDWGLDQIPYDLIDVMSKIIALMMILLPMIATAGLGYAMRISNLFYVCFAVAILPFISFAFSSYIAMTFFV